MSLTIASQFVNWSLENNESCAKGMMTAIGRIVAKSAFSISSDPRIVEGELANRIHRTGENVFASAAGRGLPETLADQYRRSAVQMLRDSVEAELSKRGVQMSHEAANQDVICLQRNVYSV